MIAPVHLLLKPDMRYVITRVGMRQRRHPAWLAALLLLSVLSLCLGQIAHDRYSHGGIATLSSTIDADECALYKPAAEMPAQAIALHYRFGPSCGPLLLVSQNGESSRHWAAPLARAPPFFQSV
jgi:hypothetical protein